MVIKLENKNDYVKFIRALTSILAQRIRRSDYGKKLPFRNKGDSVLLGKIFTLRPYTRILSWGRQFKNALEYQVLNQLEALNLIVRKKKMPPRQGSGRLSFHANTSQI